jgi:hypothetical protein
MATDLCLGEMDRCELTQLPYELHTVIAQYQDSPNLKAYISSFILSAIQAIDDALNLSLVLSIDCVEGRVLDLIGEIIVQPRPYIDVDGNPWFALEDNLPDDPLSAGLDEGKWWDGKSPLLGMTRADDRVYRIFLKSKIAKNVSKGTHNELSGVIQSLSCRDDIVILGSNGNFRHPYAHIDQDATTRGLDQGEWGLTDQIQEEPMQITLKGMNEPIDTFLFSLFTQYDILPIPAGVKLIVDQT